MGPRILETWNPEPTGETPVSAAGPSSREGERPCRGHLTCLPTPSPTAFPSIPSHQLEGPPEGQNPMWPALTKFPSVLSPSPPPALGEKSWLLTKATQALQVAPGELSTPDFAPLPPVLTDLHETLHMLFPLPGRSSPSPSLPPVPNIAVTFHSTSGSELRPHFLKELPHPEPPASLRCAL